MSRRLLGRYAATDLIGQGGQGQVFAGVDERTLTPVALKLLRPASPRSFQRLRAETLALRSLTIQGVIPLLDEGWDRGDFVIVMPLVEGPHFPRQPTPWSELQALALALLRVLGAVHSAGLVHLDLKPSNVLVGSQGPVVLDFGLGAPAGQAATGGTPRWMAPEQARGEPVDGRTDLYAVGVMLGDALGSDAPDWAREVVDRMQGPSPDGRPSSAARAARTLGAVEPDLEQVPVAGPQLFFHVVEDANALLDEVADPLEEKRRWLRHGHARLHDGALQLTRAGLDAARAAHQDPNQAAARGRAAVGRGDWAVAQPALRLALAVRRSQGASCADLLASLTLGALQQESAAALQTALGELDRGLFDGEPVDELAELARQFQLALQGAPERALELEPEPLDDPSLESWRPAARLWSLARLGRAEEGLRALQGWATDPQRQSRLLGWQGLLHYRAGRYSQALACHSRRFELSEQPLARVASAVNAASAALEGLDLDAARRWGTLARDHARTLRHAKYEAMGVQELRAAAYRAGAPLAPRPDLAEAAAALGPIRELRMALNEAAFAWRAGHPSALGLATRARDAAARFGLTDGQTLAQGLIGVLGGPPPTCDQVRAITRPLLRLQAEGLLSRCGGTPDLTWAKTLNPSTPHMRRELLSPAEALAACDPTQKAS